MWRLSHSRTLFIFGNNMLNEFYVKKDEYTIPMKRLNRIIPILVLLALIFATAHVQPAYAAGITVNSSADTTADDGTCTLREALANANGDSQLYVTFGECAAGSGSDSISFDSGLSGSVIYLQSTLTISQSVTIDGSSLTSQIILSGDGDNNGTGDVRVFTISGTPTVMLKSLTIRKGGGVGIAGAGINNPIGATLTITNSTISENEAGSNGGGIRNDGTLTMTNSTFSNNSAISGSGGGIRNAGALIVANSTFSNNSTSGSGGGIYNTGSYTLTVTNSTFSANQAASQGGGIYYGNLGTLNYANTIIANSITNSLLGGDCQGNGTIGTNLNNLVENASTSTCSALLSGDPNLDSLADNGGPTQTFALLSTSSAIDAGDDTTCNGSLVNGLDQRGESRSKGERCDIGAYEAPVLLVTKTADTDDGVCDSDCSLREAIATAESGDIIRFSASLSGLTIHLASNLTLSQDVTIDGSALASQITISGDSDDDGTGDVGVFVVSGTPTVVLNSLKITKGLTDIFPGGSGIYNPFGSTLTITNSTLSDNVADNNSSSGGAIRNDGTLTITNSTISNNQTLGGPGGGIRNDGTLTVTNSTFSGNSTNSGSGGGIRNVGTLTVTNSTFSNNSAYGSGGGIYNANGYISATITNSTFSGNSAGSQGGGMYYGTGGTLNYANTIVADSTLGGDCAGAITGTIGTNTNNLVEDGSCSTSGVNFLSGDPSLDILDDNGGSTQTIALISGSSAIDAGDNTICAASPVNNLDQRGITRPVGTTCDIGAFEGSIADTRVPSVTTFVVTTPTSNLNIPITTFVASDNLAVTGYMITESAIQPAAGDSGWTGSAPNTYTVGGAGDYILYPWAKDAAGYVSAVVGSPTSVTVDMTAPTTTSFTRQTPSSSLTNADELTFRVTFSEPVSGVDAADFAVSGTTAAIDDFNPVSASVYDIYIYGDDNANDGDLVSYNGVVGLDFNSPTITDLAGNALPNTEPSTDDTYTLDNTTPTVSSSVRADPSPTSASSVDFTVTFSESVTGVDVSDFSLITSGVTGASITNVSSDSGATRTVTVNTGAGNGTIRLDVFDDDIIQDAAGNSQNGDYGSGETYTVNKTITFSSTSTAAQDGWILETSETSGLGGLLNSSATVFYLGDDAAKKQYRSIVSFNTSSLPDNAVITKVTLKLKKQGVAGGGNPVSIFQGFVTEVKKGTFSTSALQVGDFSVTANKTIGAQSPALVSGWYSLNLTVGKGFINKLATSGGLTQIRLRFNLDDNNNTVANYLKLYSGNAGAASRPQLIVEYYIP